jgi:hypothetical protein
MLEPIDSISPAGREERERTELTSTHVRSMVSRWGREEEVAIPLHLLSSVSFRYVAPLGWLFVAAVAAAAAGALVVTGISARSALDDPAVIGALGGAAIFLVALALYAIGRRQVLVLASSTAKIALSVRGGDSTVLRDFAARVEHQQAQVLAEGLARAALEDGPPRSRLG